MIFSKASLIGDMGNTVLKKGNTVDTQVETQHHNDEIVTMRRFHICSQFRWYADTFTFSVLWGRRLGIVKGAILLDINNFSIFLSYLRIWEYSKPIYATVCCQVRAILCGSYVFGFYLQVILPIQFGSSDLVPPFLILQFRFSDLVPPVCPHAGGGVQRVVWRTADRVGGGDRGPRRGYCKVATHLILIRCSLFRSHCSLVPLLLAPCSPVITVLVLKALMMILITGPTWELLARLWYK